MFVMSPPIEEECGESKDRWTWLGSFTSEDYGDNARSSRTLTTRRGTLNLTRTRSKDDA